MHKPLRIGWYLAALLGLCWLSVHSPLQGEEIRVWAAGCTEKILEQERSSLPHDQIWDAETKTVRLEGVRGEHLPFQVIVSTAERLVENIWIEPSRLVSDSSQIGVEQISRFLMPLVNVYAATQDHGRSGRWPDPLVPLVEPFDMTFYWYSQKINQQSVWIDVAIPFDQTPGIYRGDMVVSVGGDRRSTIAVEIVVHDLQLPKKRDFPVHVGLYENHIARVHGVEPGSDEFRSVFDRYLEYLLEHRCDPRTSPGFTGEIQQGEYRLTANRPDLEKRFLDGGRLQYWISPVPIGVPRPAEVPFPLDYQQVVREHVAQIIEHSQQAGWFGQLGFHLPVDEPNSADDYRAARHWASLVKSVDAQVPVAITEQPKPENSDWGSLQEHIDAWIINGNYLAGERASIEAVRKRGDQLFWYVSCDQLFPQPNLYIDREAADTRMIPWIAWRYDLTGFLYWNGTYWGEVLNPWRDPVTWKTLPCNLPAAGEGSLFYPGNLVRRFAGQPNVAGPIGSIRLKLLREGLEERALFQMLTEKIGRPAVETLIGPVCRDIRHFSRDPNELDRVRKRVIEALLAEPDSENSKNDQAR